MSCNLIDECYQRAREARRSSETASTPSQKAQFLELQQRWLVAAAMRTVFGATLYESTDGAAEMHRA